MNKNTPMSIWHYKTISTPLGTMIAIADDTALYLLEFEDRLYIPEKIARLHKAYAIYVQPGINRPLQAIEIELKHYFNRTITEFKTPVCYTGTPFQQTVWHQLRHIPFGTTISYAQLAMTLDKPTAYRAVAQANSANSLALIIPCHRVINANGLLGGYNGGIERKQWLLEHEK